MMKIKCWISGSASDAGNNNNNNSNATKKAIVIKSSSTTTTTTEKRQVNGSGSSGCNKESPDAAGGGAAAAVAGVVAKMRPTSLNVNQLNYNVVDLKKFVRDAFTPWRSREACGVVPAQQIRDLFKEFNFTPTERQVTDMLQTAKQFARRYQLDGGKTHLDGLTFGEFCILLADLRGFRSCSSGGPVTSAAAAATTTTTSAGDGKSATELNNNNNNNHDSPAKSSLVISRSSSSDAQSPPAASTAGVIKAAKAAYEQKLRAASSVTTNKVHLNFSRGSATGGSPSSAAGVSGGGGGKSVEAQARLSEIKNDKVESDERTKEQEQVTEKQEEGESGSFGDGPEVFLGGSCNPTTWRADVAIPTLNQLGISFYNPQVSDWTPDLIELEHRAKEKARVLFFVMDSETRATAGAIEAAHIAGLNTKQLVLVLHPYKPNQKILTETVSKQEFIDLTRNQNLLRLLVIRRGLPITDSIPSGLQRIKAILSGLEERNLPSNIASRLISVRRAFDRLVGKHSDEITVGECQIALSYLGYNHSILSEDNIKKILQVHRDITMITATTPNSARGHHSYGSIFKRQASQSNSSVHKCGSVEKRNNANCQTINFEEFCVISAYLSVLQQELNENTCVSPIKGTNLPPPPIFLTNAPEWIHNRTLSFMESATIATTVTPTEDGVTIRQKQFYNLRLKSSVSRESRKRDSGTSSPLPLDARESHNDSMLLAGSSSSGSNCARNCTSSSGSSVHRQLSSSNRMSSTNAIPNRNSQPLNEVENDMEDDDDDSNDSVFSEDESSTSSDTSLEIRDVYLGGSCMRRTRWRQDYVIPLLKAKGISYHNPDDFDWTLSMGDIQYMNEMTAKGDARVAEAKTSSAREGESEKEEQKITGENDEEQEAEKLRQMLEEPVFNPALLDASRVLLFVITNETRSLAPMTLAAHYIGLGYDVVLCVQMLTDSIIYGNEVLTPTAIKDYNRGRQYLMDLAKRQRIPVYDDIQAATECALEKANVHKSIASI